VIDLDSADLETVRRILRRHVPEYEVRAFGSRVAGKARRLSDLDLAIMTDRPLSWERSAELREAFTESDLPMKVDVLDWSLTGDTFRRIVESRFEVIQAAAAPVR
jgi:uncharacterized protein